MDDMVKRASSKNGRVRHSVAIEPTCPLNLLLQLAGDSEYYVKKAVARHPALTLDMVKDNMQVFYDFKLEWFDRHPDLDFAYKAKEFIENHRDQVC